MLTPKPTLIRVAIANKLLRLLLPPALHCGGHGMMMKILFGYCGTPEKNKKP